MESRDGAWRFALALLVLVSACGDDDGGGGGGGGGTQPDAIVDSPPDSPAPRCGPEGLCSEGVMCGAGCCNARERCDNGTCKCGDGPACDERDYCHPGGPVLPTHGCGVVCCGPVSGVGCPI